MIDTFIGTIVLFSSLALIVLAGIGIKKAFFLIWRAMDPNAPRNNEEAERRRLHQPGRRRR